MQTKRSYFFAGALGEGAENVKQTKNTWHTAQKKSKPVCFCTPFLKLPPEIFLFGRKSNFSDALLEKGEQKSSEKKSGGFFFGGRSCAVCQVKIMRVRELGLCRVPGKKILEKRFIVLPGS